MQHNLKSSSYLGLRPCLPLNNDILTNKDMIAIKINTRNLDQKLMPQDYRVDAENYQMSECREAESRKQI